MAKQATVYALYCGASPNGHAVHPHDEAGRYDTLEEAQEAAEALSGRRLHWTWMPERNVWRARTGPGQAAEIEPQYRLAGIRLDVSVM